MQLQISLFDKYPVNIIFVLRSNFSLSEGESQENVRLLLKLVQLLTYI